MLCIRNAALGAALSLGLLGGMPSSARADGFTASQREEIVAIVRQALKTDPSILSDAILSLRAQAEKSQAADSGQAVRRNQAALSGVPGDFIAGNPRGDITLVAFYDPRCPYCRKALPDLDTLVAGDHRIRLVEKLIPILGPASLLQSRAIAAAGLQDRYAELQHALMRDPGQPGLDQIRVLAAQQGLNLTRLDRDMADPALEARLQAAVALARQLGITGTPSFVVGGKVIEGDVGLDELRQAVADAHPG